MKKCLGCDKPSTILVHKNEECLKLLKDKRKCLTCGGPVAITNNYVHKYCMDTQECTHALIFKEFYPLIKKHQLEKNKSWDLVQEKNTKIRELREEIRELKEKKSSHQKRERSKSPVRTTHRKRERSRSPPRVSRQRERSRSPPRISRQRERSRSPPRVSRHRERSRSPPPTLPESNFVPYSPEYIQQWLKMIMLHSKKN